MKNIVFDDDFLQSMWDKHCEEYQRWLEEVGSVAGLEYFEAWLEEQNLIPEPMEV